MSPKKARRTLHQAPRQQAPAFGPDRGNAFFAASGPGQALSPSHRRAMEAAFGVDFAAVRVHRDDGAAELNQTLGARAFTHGRDIYFNRGEFQPGTRSGQHLLAHELTHVVQQGFAPPQPHRSGPGRAPAPSIQRAITNVRHNELVTYLSQPEGATATHLLSKYLAEPGLMSTQRAVIGDLIGRVQAGDPPHTAQELLAQVQTHESDLGTALIICHNITRALARGSTSVQWSNRSRDPLVYDLAGTAHTFDPAQFHRDAVPISSRGEHSVFYAMFSDLEFGTRDEGDWYHYFALASTTYYHLTGGLAPDRPDPASDFTGQLVRTVAAALRDSSVTTSAAYDSWLIANAVSFLEGGAYGSDQADVDAESAIHIQGASAALATQGLIPESNWSWAVPRAGSITPQDLLHFQLRPNDMVARRLSRISGRFDLHILHGTAPDQLHETPDPYVRLPGWFGARTTVVNASTSPVWNERLTTLSYRELETVTLQMYDEDIAFDDHIADFSEDLRPQGQTSQTFDLSSGSARLSIRVEAAGRVVLVEP